MDFIFGIPKIDNRFNLIDETKDFQKKDRRLFLGAVAVVVALGASLTEYYRNSSKQNGSDEKIQNDIENLKEDPTLYEMLQNEFQRLRLKMIN